MKQGTRIGRRRYVGICTAGPHKAILTSGKGTYCWRHRLWRRWRSWRQKKHARKAIKRWASLR